MFHYLLLYSGGTGGTGWDGGTLLRIRGWGFESLRAGKTAGAI